MYSIEGNKPVLDFGKTIIKYSKEYRLRISPKNLKRIELIYNGVDSDGEDMILNSYYANEWETLEADRMAFLGVSFPTKPRKNSNIELYKTKYNKLISDREQIVKAIKEAGIPIIVADIAKNVSVGAF